MFRIVLIVSFIYSVHLFAQQDFQVYQDSIINLSNLAVKGETDEERNTASKQLSNVLIRVLSQEASFNYSFDAVKSIAILNSPDKAFRLFNWNEPQENGTYLYYCIIQSYNKKTKKTDVFQLNDDQRKNNNRLMVEQSNMQYPHWYGALYYQILYNKNKKEKYYTLLAWEGKDKLTTCKIIDALHFNKNGEPEFGSQIFPTYNEEKGYDDKTMCSRIIFEYANQTSMSLKYDAEKKQIVYDFLAPADESYKGKYAYYGPDMSYDALQFKKGRWILIEKVEPKNKKD